MKITNEKVLVIGSTGEIGTSLIQYLDKKGYETIGTSRKSNHQKNIKQFDLNDKEYSFDFKKFDVCIVLGSVAKILRCEESPEETRKINVTNTIRLIKKCLEENTYVIFLSTNCVFSGEKGFYKVSDKVCPMNNYGKFKAEVEDFLFQYPKNTVCVLRITKVISESTPLIREWKLKLDKNQDIFAFSDKYISPITLQQVNDAIHRIIRNKRMKLCHLGGKEEVSYLSLAKTYFSSHKNSKRNIKQILFEPKKGNNSRIHSSLETFLPREPLE